MGGNGIGPNLPVEVAEGEVLEITGGGDQGEGPDIRLEIRFQRDAPVLQVRESVQVLIDGVFVPVEPGAVRVEYVVGDAWTDDVFFRPVGDQGRIKSVVFEGHGEPGAI